MLRLSVLLSFAAILALGVTACQKKAPISSAPPFRIAAAYWPGAYWIDVANSKGWFQEAGLNAQIIDVNADFFGSFSKLSNGELDSHAPPIFDFVRLNAEGHQLTGVLVTDFTQGAEAIVARPGIEKMQDLRGKKVALDVDTYAEHVFGVIADRDSLPINEVQIVDVAGEHAHEEFIKGNVDAAFVFVPFIEPALKGVPGSKIIFSSAEIPGLSGGIQCFRREFVQKRPDDVRKVLQVWKRASEFIKTHPEEAYAIVAKINKIPIEEVREFPKVDHVLGVHENDVAFSFTSGFDSIHGNIRRINDFMIRKKMTARTLDTTEILDPTFVRELK